MIRAKVAAKRKGQIVVVVDQVKRQWRTSRAKDAESLVGKRVLVAAGPHDLVRRFVAGLEVGETIELDVANKEGEVLTVLELTEEQRERAKK